MLSRLAQICDPAAGDCPCCRLCAGVRPQEGQLLPTGSKALVSKVSVLSHVRDSTVVKYRLPAGTKARLWFRPEQVATCGWKPLRSLDVTVEEAQARGCCGGAAQWLWWWRWVVLFLIDFASRGCCTVAVVMALGGLVFD